VGSHMDAVLDYTPLAHWSDVYDVASECASRGQAYPVESYGGSDEPAMVPTCSCMLSGFAESPSNDERATQATSRGVAHFFGAFPTWSNNPRYPTGNATWGGLNSGANGGADSEALIASGISQQMIQTKGLAVCGQPSPSAFETLMRAQLDRSIDAIGGCPRSHDGAAAGSDVGELRQLVIVNAWNEWGEQAVLETTAEDGDSMLRAHQRAIEATDTRLRLASVRSRPLEGGIWGEERVEQSFIAQAVQTNDVVLELGANIGRSSVQAAIAAGPTGKVISTEADPQRRMVAARNAADLAQVKLISAISDTPLTLDAADAAGGSLGASTGNGYAQGGTTTYTVTTTKVRTITQSMRPNVVIADCEGCFDQTFTDLQNASNGRFFDNTHTIVLEHDSSDMAAQRQTHAALMQMGFRPTVCVAHPYDSFYYVDEFLYHDCFWSVLQRTDSTQPTVMVKRGPLELMSAFEARAEAATLNAVI